MGKLKVIIVVVSWNSVITNLPIGEGGLLVRYSSDRGLLVRYSSDSNLLYHNCSVILIFHIGLLHCVGRSIRSEE